MQNIFFKEINIPQQSQINGEAFPKIYSPSLTSSFVHLQAYIATNRKYFIHQISQHGSILLRGFDIKSPNDAVSILNKLGLQSFPYLGGAAVRNSIIKSEVSDSVELFTTNQAPGHQQIPFHNELLQDKDYPDLINFYCFDEADVGGSTPIVHCGELYDYVLLKHAEFLLQLESLKVRYIRVVGQKDNPKSTIGRGWKNIFSVETREEAEKVMKSRGYSWEWIQNEDRDCRLISDALDAITVSSNGRKVFCNQMIAVFKGWKDDKNSPTHCLKFGDFTQIPTEILQDISNYADSIKAAITWKKGDILLVDNKMVAHSREPFQGRHRKIYTSLLRSSESVIRQVPSVVLHTGRQMPLMGYGTWKISNNVCSQSVYQALKNNYRLLDCAACYGNEVEVGEGIKRAISENLISRDELFVTSKLWNTYHRAENVRPAFFRTLKDLNLEYIDLYLIHFPISLKFVPFQARYPPEWMYDLNQKKMIEDEVPIIETWRVLEDLVKEGYIKHIGISNFNVSLIRDLWNQARVKPSVLQVQLHPYYSQKNLVRYCRQKGIQITSYSTFGASSYIPLSMAGEHEVISNEPLMNQIGLKYNKTCFQVALRWAVQQGIAVIPKSTREEKIRQNADIFDFSLTEGQMMEIDGLNRNRIFNDPADFCEKFFGAYFPIFE